MMIERERFIELGGFDERYFLFYEDIDLSFRAAAAGLRVTVDRGWRVRHDLGHSARRHLDTALLASYRSGRLFHAELGHNLRAYDTYVAVDAVARWIRMAAKRDRSGRGAYSKVFGEASRHLLERSVVAGR